MGTKWTNEQQQVIDARHKNLLVSAAAGSGKTAVLVERIIAKVTDQKSPVDIDRLLIVTFTNAAAAQMRERIGKAIEAALKKSPDNVHLLRQQTLLYSAQITTIHSFCLHIIRNYFHKIDLDPSIRVAEEGELKLLKGEVLDDILESCYEEGDLKFIDFVETFATGKHDNYLKDLILQLYDFSMSDPWPKEWLNRCLIPYQCSSISEFLETPHGRAFFKLVGKMASAWADELRQACLISAEEDGPQMYVDLLEEEAACMEKLSECKEITSLYEEIHQITFKRLPAARKFSGDPNKKVIAQDLRNSVKDSIKKIKQKFFYQNPTDMVQELNKNEGVTATLIDLTLAFSEAFAQKKADKNLMDYNDLEHFALKILVDEETKEPTQTAKELRQYYEEIMVDEYQDSNYVQEAIITSISKEAEGSHNVFMVGDVKQSIYRFRMARPELFMDKYDSYELLGEKKQRIDLHKNFRSRKEVIEAVNDVFLRVMAKDIGNIDYDNVTSLHQGGNFIEAEEGHFQTEIRIADMDSFQKMQQEGRAGTEFFGDPKETEARMIADKINELMEHQMVIDEEQGKLRKIRFDDIVILLRSMQGYADLFIQVLKDHKVPARATSGTGYFSAIEVKTVLNLLKIIDNPRQDIPMTAVLKSPVVGLSGEELAMIRAQFHDKNFYQAVFLYGEEGGEISLKEKISEFLSNLSRYRNWVSYKPIHELLYDVMEDTGYYAYVYAMPGGTVRQGNLQMLLEKAIAFEKTSYRGLFHFIRYMDQLQKYDVDFGEAVEEEQEEAVRIMSIHKSKGLEFPVVILAGMGKQFNQQDIRGKMLLHPELGIGIDRIDPVRRLKSPCLIKQIQASLSKIENWGEELRVLYVAMTRAKEKLILTGTLKKAEDKLAAMEYIRTSEDGYLSYLKRLNGASYFDWVLPALHTYGDKYEMKLIRPEDILAKQFAEEIKEGYSYRMLENELRSCDQEMYEEIERRFSYQYPYESEINMKMKISVSEIKHRSTHLMKEEETVSLFEEEAVAPYVPQFMMEDVKEQEGKSVGALRGTAMHRILECFDFAKDASSLTEQIEQMFAEKRIDAQIKTFVSTEGITAFLDTDLAKRMQQAAIKGKLYKEKPFMMGKPAKDVLEDSESEEMILVQGIIDVFFEEENEIILVDYKTDRVRHENVLKKRYLSQLELYAEALKKATGKEIKEKVIYSFCLKREIKV